MRGSDEARKVATIGALSVGISAAVITTVAFLQSTEQASAQVGISVGSGLDQNCSSTLYRTATTTCENGPAISAAAASVSRTVSGVVLDHLADTRGQMQSSGVSGNPPLAYAPAPVDPGAFTAVVGTTQPVTSTNRAAVWTRAFGETQTDSAISVVNGVAIGVAAPRQTTFGVLSGIEAQIEGLTSRSDGLIVGPFGGYQASGLSFPATGSSARLEGGSFGITSSYFNGGFFLDGLLQAQFLNLHSFSGGLAGLPGVNVTNVSIGGTAGYRYTFASGIYIEPSAGADYNYTQYGAGAQALGLIDGGSTRGKLGARLGSVFTIEGLRYEPFVTGTVLHIFDSSNTSPLFTATPGAAMILPKNGGKYTYAEVTAGVTILSTNGVSGFVKAQGRLGEIQGVGGQAGVRIRF